VVRAASQASHGGRSARSSRTSLLPLPSISLSGPDTLGTLLRKQRELRGMSVVEVSRVTRISASTLGALESDHFDDLPGEVFVRGFLRSYAQAVGLSPEEVLARYTSSRRVSYVTPLPVSSPVQSTREGNGRRFGVAIAFVLLLILFTLALSIVLKPRGHDMPNELSGKESPAQAPAGALGSRSAPITTTSRV
jgi:cytoskeletal protein RodZ